MSLLLIDQLCVRYGGIEAVRGVSLTVSAGELVTLVGANGAGKSSTLSAIAGLVPAASGTVQFAGADVLRQPVEARVGQGLALVPEGRGVFAKLTVLENLQMGAYCRRDNVEVARDLAEQLQRFPRLAERRYQLAGTLSGGEQQMLVMARALMSRPKLLLLDEPSMGLAPILVAQIFELVQEIAAAGVAVLLVEQNAKQALAIAHRAYVMESGEVTLSGSAKTLADDPRVQAAYLGT